LADLSIDLYATAVLTTGTAWEVIFPGMTDQFLSGFAMEVYNIPEVRLPFFATEFFLTKETDGTSTLQIRFADKSNPPTKSNRAPSLPRAFNPSTCIGAELLIPIRLTPSVFVNDICERNPANRPKTTHRITNRQ